MTEIAPAPLELRDHPARFAPIHLERAHHYLALEAERIGRKRLRVLDPCAGVGTFHQLPHDTVGVELEPEWAGHHAGTHVGDSTNLAWLQAIDPQPFHAVFSSYTYANRLADTYDGSGDRCTTKGCGKDGAPPGWRLAEDDDPLEDTEEVPHYESPLLEPSVVIAPCEDCGRTGRRPSKRLTYRIALGRYPSPNNTGVLQWGAEYRRLHRLITTQAAGLLAEGGLYLLNVSNSVRTVGSGDRKRLTFPPVVEFHMVTLARAGFYVVAVEELATPRFGFGQNRNVRTEAEHLLVFRKGHPSLKVPPAEGGQS